MKDDDRRVPLTVAIGATADERRQPGVRPRQVTLQLWRRVIGEVGELDQLSGPRAACLVPDRHHRQRKNKGQPSQSDDQPDGPGRLVPHVRFIPFRLSLSASPTTIARAVPDL